MKKRKLKKLGIIVLSVLIMLLIIAIIAIVYFLMNNIENKKNLSLELNNNSPLTIEYGNSYEELGATAKFKNLDISNEVIINSNIDTSKIGTYKVTYIVKYKNAKKIKELEVNVTDSKPPEITLKGENKINLFVGKDFIDPGFSAIDNYDGDLTNKVETSNNIDKTKPGTYEITYKIKDSSNNETIKTREISYENDNPNQKVAVLNYHFFYDPDIGESCNEDICEKVSDFKNQLTYLKDNGFTTLSMEEFRAWMYNESPIPEKSVLITIDDGAMGTGSHNGNKLIPILEEYKMHATLFLITGWWDIKNYSSEYLDIESHTNDMHTGNICKEQSRGAQLLCSSNEAVMKDLKTSIEKTKSTTAFCFPFYAYNDTAINQVKESGFKLAFIGGNKKVSKNTDKWHMPRYPISKKTTLESFIKMVN